MIAVQNSLQNKGTTVCLLLQNPKSYIIVISMKKKLQILKLFGRPLNRSYLIKLYQERNQPELKRMKSLKVILMERKF